MFLTPQSRWHIVPRLDLQLTPKNTLTVRYSYSRIDDKNQGVGNFSLASRAYNVYDRDHILQATGTAVLSAHVNE